MAMDSLSSVNFWSPTRSPKACQLTGTVCFQIIKGELDLLIIFVNGIDQAALRFARQRNHITVFIGVKLELAAAKGDLFTGILVV
ncbi:Uncharacterised protein [Salmonella enterica subsp. enterica serovar Daytona]|uniref:Uncharacterized protein n=1 Tax=Salmonella enterica subsp. enterica serovar Daytona TaxID=1962639 RepID=A0A447JI41_SALET|nr:Uncharacterised protein [Salmonella enterica subsp. enterica serovar Daytona]